MPYYCTVPRCTSMAGKVKNVSFHQFPRDEELAKLWNKILKRGKPYTKYSKVCSLHFTPDDYTITNAGQWRTLRKDAIPSRNLPTEAPPPYHGQDATSWSPGGSAIDPRLHQQMAQAIYVQTMLAMQAATVSDVSTNLFSNDQPMPSPQTDSSRSPPSHPSDQMDYAIDNFENDQTDNVIDGNSNTDDNTENRAVTDNFNVVGNTGFVNRSKETYKCNECSKCFKDPDVFYLHRRVHNKSPLKSVENENLDANTVENTQETLKANPILANLLRSGIPQGSILGPDLDVSKAFDNSVVSIESQIMTALAANMENYLRNLSTIMTNSTLASRITPESTHEDDDNISNIPDNDEDDGPNTDEVDDKIDSCDKKDLNDSRESSELVIDEDNC